MSRKTDAPPEDALELLTDPEGAAIFKVGMTRFLDIQKSPDFPKPIWLGPRGKRHIKNRLIAFALSKTERAADRLPADEEVDPAPPAAQVDPPAPKKRGRPRKSAQVTV